MNFNFKKFCTVLAQKQLSFSEVAKKSSIDISNISRYAKGKTKPTPRNIGKLAKALNINISELID